MANLVKIQLRRDLAANWDLNNPILAEGEPALELDTGKMKYGNGTDDYNTLPYFETDKNYVFTQGVASATWTVNHKLDKFPSPVIVDSGGSHVTGAITHIDKNNLIITFANAFTGKAYIN